ncbi:uncharacterized protein [Miscanthus floridulus]|uniref:uncharacterized protein n=1 Tax=Miscanthus floridulus TaxID=154761 RepID=UPI00345802FD
MVTLQQDVVEGTRRSWLQPCRRSPPFSSCISDLRSSEPQTRVLPAFAEKEAAADPEKTLREVTDNLGGHMPAEYLDVVRLSDHGNLSWAPLLYRNPVSVLLGAAARRPVTVAGDAFHPMTPDMAQGGCSALEDAVVLAVRLGRPAFGPESLAFDHRGESPSRTAAPRLLHGQPCRHSPWPHLLHPPRH